MELFELYICILIGMTIGIIINEIINRQKNKNRISNETIRNHANILQNKFEEIENSRYKRKLIARI